ncbi:putative DsbA family dithiol-disulfide isomerase [Paraburkholderia sp. BL6669N2]|uniref:DsbA family oxidoreductase n=1 Tax=Paraburkholderia sp. BL6669N2 TaxID=1938807 RepID=UPI000E235AB4|nr:DsbA family oxidoreductase [Paraburkholderia sp. BL6669N2]REG48994.1 putative DsbA family dithiol-disulfide isomerase [Paraburkholderia sp. BL6669N2]
MKSLDIEITYDFICPWCWIGHSNLKNALKDAAPGLTAKLSYAPYELNPSMPRAGASRKEYRTAKFGSWARSQAMDADVTSAGRKLGLDFNYDRIDVTPNTRLAHRLLAYAQRVGDEKKTEALFEAIFSAYFSRGENIGTLEVLVQLAVAAGFEVQDVRDFLGSAQGEAEVVAKELEAQSLGVSAVPSVRVGDSRIGGAQPSAIFAAALRAALDVSSTKVGPTA